MQVNGVLQDTRLFSQEKHFASDKIGKKAQEVAERRSKSSVEALAQAEMIRDQHMLYSFLQVHSIYFNNSLLSNQNV